MDLRTDELTRRLYANDASMYQEVPKAVAFPQSVSDIVEIVEKAEERNYSITPRAAGTSLAGQTTGGSLVMDISRHLTGILELDAEEKWARIQPGVIRDSLNREAAKHGLFFAPDTSTTNRCMLGGMIGNNSSGSFSVKYGTTREHVMEMDVVLSDGSQAMFKPLTKDELEAKTKLLTLEGHIYREMLKVIEQHRDSILRAYPHAEIIRRNTGYALDKLCEMQPFNPAGQPFNLCELLCGSEGTLAITTSAKVALTPIAKHKLLIIPQFRAIDDAMKATVEAVQFDVSAVELIDDIILDATKSNLEQQKNRFFLQGDPKCILIIQLEGDDPEELNERAIEIKQRLKNQKLGYTYSIFDDEERMTRVWELRKAGLGLLMGLGKDSRSPTFSEDTAVRVGDLPAYISDFKEILKKHDTSCVFYAHASVGELHLRPMIDITTEEGLEKMKFMAEEIAILVKKYRGSLSGEHGDGRARAPYIETVLGTEMIPLLEQVKEIWDPGYMLNPGKIVLPKPIDTDLRFSPSYIKPDVPTVFKWRREGGFDSAAELCNGAGVCRKLSESGGTMCPSYMVTKEEKDSTRGRANLFRQLFSGRQVDAFTSNELKEALDLCLSCKACKSECPANVDMAKMKAEFLHGWHQRKGLSFGDKIFSKLDKNYRMAALNPKLANWAITNKATRKVFQNLASIDARRSLPLFAEQSFSDWWGNRTEKVSSEEKVILFVDLFTNYHEPEIGKSAVHVLESMNIQVEVFSLFETGRTHISKGFLDQARSICHNVIDLLKPYIDQGMKVVGLEPSELLTLRDEYLDLCDDLYLEAAKKLSDHALLFEEFMVLHKEKFPYPEYSKGLPKVQLHGHCHSKALVGNTPTIEALQLVGYTVTDMNTGCCGMAGSFGYEQGKFETSMEIGELKLFPAVRGSGKSDKICAPGFSCRHQIVEGTGKRALHPAELIAECMLTDKSTLYSK